MLKISLYRIVLILSVICIGCKQYKPEIINENITKSTYTYKTLESKELRFDYYRPKENKNRLPLVVYVHGGGFYSGKRDNKNIVNFAHQLAKNNYATISISYRLTRAGRKFNCNTKAADKIKAFNAVSEDISYAVNYILEHQHELNINPKNIILAGTSAGAEALLNLVYTTTDHKLPQDFKFAGLISRAGALRSLDGLTEASAVPIQLFHGTDDGLVPYNIGSHHNCKINHTGYLKLYGSKAIANHLKMLKKPYHLVSLKNGDHGMNGLSKDIFITEALTFLNNVTTIGTKEQIENIY
jgi:predicted esterase